MTLGGEAKPASALASFSRGQLGHGKSWLCSLDKPIGYRMVLAIGCYWYIQYYTIVCKAMCYILTWCVLIKSYCSCQAFQNVSDFYRRDHPSVRRKLSDSARANARSCSSRSCDMPRVATCCQRHVQTETWAPSHTYPSLFLQNSSSFWRADSQLEVL